MNKIAIATGILILLTLPARSQSAASLTFDVVSINRNKSTAKNAAIASPPNGDSIAVTDASPRLLIAFAYDIPLHDEIYGLPNWADAESYDVLAKVAVPDLPAFHKLLPMQRNPMLQPLLADRFHLKLHFETRALPAYALVVSKGGPKLTEIQPGILSNGLKDPGGIDMSRSELTATGSSMQGLAHVLQMQLGRPIVDRTGLTGNYDFTLKFAPVQSAATDNAESGPSIFTALQEQLGLKLEPIRAPVQVIVVDHIEQPSGN